MQLVHTRAITHILLEVQVCPHLELNTNHTPVSACLSTELRVVLSPAAIHQIHMHVLAQPVE